MLARLEGGRVAVNELHRFPNIPIQLPNGLYWDTLRLQHEICESIRAAAKVAPELDGIAVDTWGVDFALIGARGELLDNPRHYRDARTAGLMEQLFETVPRREVFRRTGVQFLEINSLYQLRAIQRDSPGLLGAASHLLFMPDLFNYFLTGEFASEKTIASTSQFFDPVGKRFATDLLEKLDLPTGPLCDLIEPGTRLGSLLPHVAELRAPVYATASHDTASAVAAVPAVRADNIAYISSGTWSLMGVELTQPVIDDATLEANFTNEAGAGGTIRFLQNIPGLWMVQECRRAWARQGLELTYGELIERASSAKALDALLDLDEFTAPGDHPARICDYCRRTGQAVPEDPGSIVRVILESLAARYRRVLESLERLTHRRIEVIHIVGGGSRNRLLNQFTANSTGRRVIAGPAEATAAGNALTQAMGAGAIGSVEEIRAVVRRSFPLEEFVPA